MIITFNHRDGLWHAVFRMPHKNKVLLAYSDSRLIAFQECVNLIEKEITSKGANHD